MEPSAKGVTSLRTFLGGGEWCVIFGDVWSLIIIFSFFSSQKLIIYTQIFLKTKIET